MNLWNIWTGANSPKSQQRLKRRRTGTSLQLETLEGRDLMSASPLPVLLVIADQRDFYFKEYNDTRNSLMANNIDVEVAATTTNVSYPHGNSGQLEAGVSGEVTPDIALANVETAKYSAIAFVGGWGSSMYQYAYNDPNGDGVTDNLYFNAAYDGDSDLNDGVIAQQKIIVNDLINDFLASDKPVAAICHGVTVLAWARVDGVSPLAGRQVSVPLTVGSPNQFYDGAERYYPYASGQHIQVVANGGIANTVSGQYGSPGTAADDVVVDGRIITGENYDSAAYFGAVIAQEVLANLPPSNQAPVASDAEWSLAENSPVGTPVGMVQASDADVGQTLAYSIVGGNTGGAFTIHAATGALTVANVAALNFETNPNFGLTIRVVDNGNPSLDTFAQVLVNLTDVYEPVSMSGGSLVLTGTATNDVIYIWSNGSTQSVSAWINGTNHGPFVLAPGGRVVAHGGDGNDQIYATDLKVPVSVYGGAGHDLITGGSAGDLLDGGDGVDRLWGSFGDDLILGGAGTDYLYGREGNDVLVGGAGDDHLDGFDGRDILIGGLGADHVLGGGGEDLLIGGITSYDNNVNNLNVLRTTWSVPSNLAARMAVLSDASASVRLKHGDTVHDDGAQDVLCGGAAADWYFALGADLLYAFDADDRVTVN